MRRVTVAKTITAITKAQSGNKSPMQLPVKKRYITKGPANALCSKCGNRAASAHSMNHGRAAKKAPILTGMRYNFMGLTRTR